MVERVEEEFDNESVDSGATAVKSVFSFLEPFEGIFSDSRDSMTLTMGANLGWYFDGCWWYGEEPELKLVIDELLLLECMVLVAET